VEEWSRLFAGAEAKDLGMGRVGVERFK